MQIWAFILSYFYVFKLYNGKFMRSVFWNISWILICLEASSVAWTKTARKQSLLTGCFLLCQITFYVLSCLGHWVPCCHSKSPWLPTWKDQTLSIYRICCYEDNSFRTMKMKLFPIKDSWEHIRVNFISFFLKNCIACLLKVINA